MIGAWLFVTGLPVLVSIWTSRPGLAPSLAGGDAMSRPAMVLRPGSPYCLRFAPLASVTMLTVGGTRTAARCVAEVMFGATTSGCHLTNQTDDFACW